MKIYDYISLEELEEAQLMGYIKTDIHPVYPNIVLYNYTNLCQHDKAWNDATLKCRGVIIDLVTNEIIARPFVKFFNYEEYDNSLDILKQSNIPYNSSNIKAYDKLDGSLGILYWINGIPYITTKGSFSSEQGKHATNILHTKYKDIIPKLNPNITYLFEIIYPEDLHCITYKNVDDIILIGMIDTETGENIPIDNCDLGFPLPEIYDGKNWKNLRNEISGENREGFVILFDNQFRLKIKYESFLFLHSIRSGLTKNKVLGYLVDGRENELKEILKHLDEEHRIYYSKNIFNELNEQYQHILNTAIKDLDGHTFETQKDAAKYIMTCKYPHVMFAIYKGKKPDLIIWKLIKNMEKE